MSSVSSKYAKITHYISIARFSVFVQYLLSVCRIQATCIIPASASTGFQKNAGIDEVVQSLTVEDIANAVFYAANQPKGTVIEEMTVWGTAQEVQPL